MTSGGKSPGSARALALLQAGQAFFEEPLAPLADDLPSSVEPSSDFIVAEALGGQENHLRSDYLKIWQRISSCPLLKNALLISIEVNDEWALSWHCLLWRVLLQRRRYRCSTFRSIIRDCIYAEGY